MNSGVICIRCLSRVSHGLVECRVTVTEAYASQTPRGQLAMHSQRKRVNKTDNFYLAEMSAGSAISRERNADVQRSRLRTGPSKTSDTGGKIYHSRSCDISAGGHPSTTLVSSTAPSWNKAIHTAIHTDKRKAVVCAFPACCSCCYVAIVHIPRRNAITRSHNL